MRRASALAGKMTGRSGTCIDRRSLLLGRIAGKDPGGSQGAATYPRQFLRQINVARCIGCDVCTRVCPTGAMRIEQQEQQAFYLVDPGLCDGCGMCLDLCEVGAIEMTDGTPATRPQLVKLLSRQCRRCGAPFHLPHSAGGEDSLCRICAARTSWRR